MKKRLRISIIMSALGWLLSPGSSAAIEILVLKQPLKSDYYLSQKEITAVDGSSVPAGNQVWLVAGERIGLHGGFFVSAGARFNAVTGGIARLPKQLNLDNDVFADWWELTHFENLNQDGSGDYDNDGIGNLSEYLMNTDPADAASRPSGLVFRYDDLGRRVKVIRIPAR